MMLSTIDGGANLLRSTNNQRGRGSHPGSTDQKCGLELTAPPPPPLMCWLWTTEDFILMNNDNNEVIKRLQEHCLKHWLVHVSSWCSTFRHMCSRTFVLVYLRSLLVLSSKRRCFKMQNTISKAAVQVVRGENNNHNPPPLGHTLLFKVIWEADRCCHLLGNSCTV